MSVKGDRSTGSQTPLVLVHGAHHGPWCWQPTTDLLDGPVLAVELPGRGARPAELSQVTLDSTVKAVIEDLDHAGWDQVVLVGHSLGALTVAEVAFRHPHRVRTVAYVGSMLPHPGQSVADLVAFTPQEMPVPEESAARAMFGGGMDDPTWAAFFAQLCDEAPGLLTSPLSGRPTQPTHFVSMVHDPICPPATAAAVVGDLGPDVTHTVIAGAGHTVMITHPHVLADLLRGL